MCIKAAVAERFVQHQRDQPFMFLPSNYRPSPQPFKIPTRLRTDSRAKGTLLSCDTINYIQSPAVIITLIIESGTEKANFPYRR